MRALFISLLLCGSLFAQEFQLELLHEFEIPEPSTGSYYSHPWDVRFWMSDSLPGWAIMQDNVVYYQTDLSQPVQQFAVPVRLDSAICERFALDLYDFYRRDFSTHDVYMMRWLSRPGHNVFAAITRIMTDPEGSCADFNLLIWDATEQELLWGGHVAGSYTWYGYGIGGFADLTFAPELPNPAEVVSWVERGSSYHELQGGGSQRSSSGTASIGHIDNDSLIFVPVPENVWSTKLFARSEPITFAFFHSYYYNVTRPGGDSETEEWRGLSTFVLGESLSTDTLNSIKKLEIAAQIDHDGDMRIFNSHKYTHSAFDHELIWENEIVPATPYNSIKCFSARCGSLDEQFWVNRDDSTYFLIYRASNGNLMGRTSDFLGKPQYFIKSHPLYDRLVTFDEENHLVRIYRTPPVMPLGLTLRPAGNNTMLHLDWQPVPGANSYMVFYSDTPTSDTPYFLGSTAETNMTIPMPVNNKGFFYVEVGE